ncbi:L-aspartate oxidase [Halotalea alkalilenta]|uniref:L-aspartate oxidase n=1 Tax=Halotalea alkalilenta TaxID=376489 RepID=UPI0007D04F2C|nr:L-aspartate oxidase [Halotalea alkalilenta]
MNRPFGFTPRPRAERRGRFALVVVGSGVAGLSCALLAQQRGLGPVALVTKAGLEESNTRYAQGGIAGALHHVDRAGLHARDTLVAGAGGCVVESVRRLCAGGAAALEWLIALGVPFDREGGDWAVGLEAAHSRPRILHAGGDATGRAIEATLADHVRRADVTLFEHCMLAELQLHGGRVSGVECLDANEQRFGLEAETVVIATGGAGQVYAHTTNPSVATGDGVACAFRAGAAILDAEFYQFHPTALALGEQRFLITEALRGEGAVLRDALGRRFMPALHAQAELAPRDVVARAIARTMAAQQGQPVWLDATGLEAERLAARFPGISAHLEGLGLRLAHDWLPVTPAAHYWMGGILTDTLGRSSVAGLYALGEAACTGVHGANRLASNSLLEGVVFARRLVEALACDESQGLPARFDEIRIQVLPIFGASAEMPFSLSALRETMWREVGLERSGEGLSRSLERLTGWQRGWRFATHRAALEARNQLEIATLICESALAREESRGAHHRLDFPNAEPRFARRRAVTRLFAEESSEARPFPLSLVMR